MSWIHLLTAIAAAHPDPTDTRIDRSVVLRLLAHPDDDNRPLLDMFVAHIKDGVLGEHPMPVGILGADEVVIYIKDVFEDNLVKMIESDLVLYRREDRLLDTRLAMDSLYRSLLRMLKRSERPLLEFFLTEEALQNMSDGSPDWIYRATRMLYLGLGCMMCVTLSAFERVVYMRIDDDCRCSRRRQYHITFDLYCKLATREYPRTRLNALGLLYYLSELTKDDDRYSLLTSLFEITDVSGLTFEQLIDVADGGDPQ